MFSSANEQSIAIIVKVLEQFQRLSSLTATTQRSPTFYAGVSQEVKRQISSIRHFKESELLIRYLGVPLIARKLSALDCKALLERITAIINSWASKKIVFRCNTLVAIFIAVQYSILLVEHVYSS